MPSLPKSIGPDETKVLIVDDSKEYAQVLKRILGGVFGYGDVTYVETTEEAYRMIAKEPERFQLVFVDYNFPGSETGGDLLKRLKDSSLMEQKVAFMITSEPTVDNMKLATASGALGVVAKPFDREQLRSQLSKAALSIKTDQGESF
ncbi:MAG: response regulator [Oligoflexia bacterium]|nr:response regulator [Oligoflexia bacterium]